MIFERSLFAILKQTLRALSQVRKCKVAKNIAKIKLTTYEA